MADLADVLDNVVLDVPHKGENIDLAISGTYVMDLAFQTESGSPGSDAWTTLATFDTVDGTEALTYTTFKDKQRLRIIVTDDTSGTANAFLTDNHDRTIKKFTNFGSENVFVIKQEGVEIAGSMTSQGANPRTQATEQHIVSDTLVAADDANAMTVTNLATTMTFVLPAALGTGNRYTFLTQLTCTQDHIYEAASAADVFTGYAYMGVTGTDLEMFQTVAASDTVTLDGTISGGLLGTKVEFIDMAAGLWHVAVFANASGAQVTPFSEAV